MRQLILYSAVSLDSFIARPDGNVDWLHYPDYELPNEDYGYTEFYKTIDTTLMGNNTYKVLLGFNVPFPYPDKTNYVFSRSAGIHDDKNVKFVTSDIVQFVRELRNGNGKDIWLIGGGQLNTLLLNNDLVDQVILTQFPIVIGEGIPLFDGKAKETRFDLERSKSYPSGLLQLIFRRKK
jgi:dihydrofolate reductase